MIEWLAAALIISGMWVWDWATVCFVAILAFSENEKNVWAIVSLGIFRGLMQHSEVFSIFTEPFTLLLYAVGYFVIGGLWSCIKWSSFVNKKAELYGELKLKFIKTVNNHNNTRADFEALSVDVTTAIPPEFIAGFQKHLSTFGMGCSSYTTDGKLHDVKPSDRTYKEKIVTWILWWPTSTIWTILNDPLVRLAEWMYGRFQGFYKKIAIRAFSKFEV